jgi:hypothetical protein
VHLAIERLVIGRLVIEQGLGSSGGTRSGVPDRGSSHPSTAGSGHLGYDPAMANFMGGSAFNMVQQVAGGHLLVTERSFRRLTRPELDQLGFELEKRLRGIRGDQPPLDDQRALQQRNREIQRLNTCRMMLRSFLQRSRS